MDDCCFSFGGRIALEVDGNLLPPVDADITIEPTNVSSQAEANGDGSLCRTYKPKLYGFKVKFRMPCALKLDDLMRKCKVNATIQEIDQRRTHLFTGGVFVGEPSYSLATGQVDGCEVRSVRYQRV